MRQAVQAARGAPRHTDAAAARSNNQPLNTLAAFYSYGRTATIAGRKNSNMDWRPTPPLVSTKTRLLLLHSRLFGRNRWQVNCIRIMVAGALPRRSPVLTHTHPM